MEMVERLFLNRIDVLGDRLAVDQGEQRTVMILTDAASPPATSGDQTMKAAQLAADFVVWQAFPEFCRMKVHSYQYTRQAAECFRVARL
jgi:hypothetical protein